MLATTVTTSFQPADMRCVQLKRKQKAQAACHKQDLAVIYSPANPKLEIAGEYKTAKSCFW